MRRFLKILNQIDLEPPAWDVQSLTGISVRD